MSDMSDRKRFEALARATEELAPSDAIVDAVMRRVTAADEDVDGKLATLASATASLDASPALGDAVMLRIDAIAIEGGAASSKQRIALADGLVRSGRFALFFAAAVAAAAVLYASWTETRVYDEALVTADSIEVGE